MHEIAKHFLQFECNCCNQIISKSFIRINLIRSIRSKSKIFLSQIKPNEGSLIKDSTTKEDLFKVEQRYSKRKSDNLISIKISTLHLIHEDMCT